MGYSGAWGKLIHEKNQKQKISWHCPFKMHPRLYTKKLNKTQPRVTIHAMFIYLIIYLQSEFTAVN